MHQDRYDYSPIIHRPPLRWPSGARVALWVIPNIEHFEFDWTLAGPKPDVRNYSRRDYGNRVGIFRLMEVLDRYQIRATVALNALVCRYYPAIIEEGQRRNWEWMGHGLTNSRHMPSYPPDEEWDAIQQTVRIIAQATGHPPRGWLGPGLTESYNTPDLLVKAGIQYVCDWVNDDQPYPMRAGGGTLISMPYSIEINDAPLFGGPVFTAEQFHRFIVDQFDTLYREGEQRGRVMAIALHPYLTGAPLRIKYLDLALAHIASHEHVWFATGSEIVDWYRDHCLGAAQP